MKSLDRITTLQTELEALRLCIIDANRRHQNEVAWYERGIVEANRRLNDEVPAVSLVPELLAEVFKYCRPSLHNARRSLHDRKSPYKWIQLTHVCHRWRKAALSHAGLWNEIYATDSNADIVNLVLSRSQETPLYLYYEGRNGPREQYLVLRTLIWHIRRARTLEIRRFSEVALRDVLQNCLKANTPAPLLKSMVVASAMRPPTPNTCLVRCLGTLVCPTLTSIYLENCRFGVDHRLFGPTLQELRLKSNFVKNVSLPDLFALLAKLPRLEVLEVSSVLQAPEDERVEHLQVVRLAHLRHFRIGERLESAEHILKALLLPSLTSLVLALFHEHALDKECFVSLANAIAPVLVFSKDAKKSVTAMYLGKDCTEDNMTLRAWQSGPQDFSSGWCLPQTAPLVSIRLYNQPFEHFIALVNGLQTRNVRRLWLQGPLDLASHNHWLSRLHFPNVETLLAIGRAAYSLPELSRQRNRRASEVDDDPDPLQTSKKCFTFFPQLSSIQLQGVYFREDWDKVCDWLNFRDDFKDACTFRRDAGAPINSVKLVQCINANVGDVDDLKSVIPRIDWDKVEEYHKSDSDEYKEDDNGEGLAESDEKVGGHYGAANFFHFK